MYPQVGDGAGNAAAEHICSSPNWSALLRIVGSQLFVALLCTHAIYCRLGDAWLQLTGCPVAVIARKRSKVWSLLAPPARVCCWLHGP